MSLIDKLKELIPAEIIDGSDVDETAEMVDLDIAFKLLLVPTPVPNDEFQLFQTLPSVVKGIKRDDGNYEIRTQTEDGPNFRILTADQTKVMRARFLLLKGFYSRKFNSLTLPKQNEFQQEYDTPFVPDMLMD